MKLSVISINEREVLLIHITDSFFCNSFYINTIMEDKIIVCLITSYDNIPNITYKIGIFIPTNDSRWILGKYRNGNILFREPLSDGWVQSILHLNIDIE